MGGLGMGLNKVRLGDYIERSMVNNHDLQYGSELIEGVTSDGVFATPKGSLLDIDLKPYKIVQNGAFVYNPSRLDLGSIAYRTDGLCIVSHLYIVFYLNELGKQMIDPEYLYIYFHRDEFYREVTFRNFGSQRPEFNFYDMSDIELYLPPLHIQQKYVAIYKAMVANQQSYERGLEDLRLVCDGYIEDLRRRMPCERIGQFICESNCRNDIGLTVDSVRGLSTNKEMIATKANLDGVSLDSYKTVAPGQIAYVPDTSRRGDMISLALNDSDETYLVSSISTVFSTDTEHLLPDYLMLFFTRAEFNRYARFNSWGSARETFDWDAMCDVQIPIPSIEVQRAIAEIYAVYIRRKRINEQMKAQIRDICPILIKGSVNAGKEGCVFEDLL